MTTMWLRNLLCYVIGQCLMKMNKLTDAKEYLEKALEIKQRTSNDLATDNNDNNVATTLHVIGQCLMFKMNKLTDAKEYLEKALEIKQRTSNDLATDNNVATILLLCMMLKSIWKKH